MTGLGLGLGLVLQRGVVRDRDEEREERGSLGGGRNEKLAMCSK